MVLVVELVVEDHCNGRISRENTARPVIVIANVRSLGLLAALLVGRSPSGFSDPERLAAGDDSFDFRELHAVMENVVVHGNALDQIQEPQVDERSQISDALRSCADGGTDQA